MIIINDFIDIYIYISLMSCIKFIIIGPEFSKDEWLNVKYELGLDFPNVCICYIVYYRCYIIK